MGCGASTSRRSNTYRANNTEDEIVDGVGNSKIVDDAGNSKSGPPSNIVLAEATRPDWGRPDHIVFETKFREDESSIMPPGSLDPNRSPSRGPGKESMKFSEKFGRFFSKRQNCLGQWKIAGNVLTLVWPDSITPDVVIAMKSPRVWHNKHNKLTITVIEPAPNSPDWFSPEEISEKFQTEAVSAKQFECPVCFFELYKFQTGVIRSNSRRTCRHYFHTDCAKYLLQMVKGTGRGARCPVCSVQFTEVKLLPDLTTHPREWFSICDADFGGELDAEEVIEALGCVMPLSRYKLEKTVRAHWCDWDPDMDGTISLREFIMPKRGLRDWIIEHLSMLMADAPPRASAIPSIDQHPREWFHLDRKSVV